MRFFQLKFFFFLVFLSGAVFAEIEPFGIKLRGAFSEVKKKYKVKHAGINKYTQGDMYTISSDQVSFSGLKTLLVICDKEKKVRGVLATVNKNRYQEIAQMLEGKYALVDRKEAFVGNKFSKFKSEGVQINVIAPHLSFELDLEYIDDSLHESFEKTRAKEESEKSEAERSAL